MQANGVATSLAATQTGNASGTNNSSNSLTSTALGNSNLFISLLTAELQAQDPTNAMSPDQMVSQLTEVSSLQQLISINQTLTNLAGTPASTPPTTPTVQTASAAQSPQSPSALLSSNPAVSSSVSSFSV